MTSKQQIAARQATNARLAAQDRRNRCYQCKRALLERQAYIIAGDLEGRRFCSDACLDTTAFLEGIGR